MKEIKSFKLANAVLATALALALSGCGSDSSTSESVTEEVEEVEVVEEVVDCADTDTCASDFSADEFIIMMLVDMRDDILSRK